MVHNVESTSYISGVSKIPYAHMLKNIKSPQWTTVNPSEFNDLKFIVKEYQDGAWYPRDWNLFINTEEVLN